MNQNTDFSAIEKQAQRNEKIRKAYEEMVNGGGTQYC